MSAGKQFLTNAGVAVSATLLALALAEGALRVGYGMRHRRAAQAARVVDLRDSAEAYDDPADHYGKHDLNPAMDYSTHLGYVSRAGVSGNGYRTNVHHARYDEDFPAAKPEGERRVFVTGGSTTWGQGVDQASVFTAVAERLFQGTPRPQGRRVRVVSMGVTAYSSVQERILVENLVAHLSPDVVVMFSGWNDLYFGYIGKDVLREQDFLKFRQVLAKALPWVAPPRGAPAVHPPDFADYSSRLRYFIDVRLFAWRNREREQVAAAVQREALPVRRAVDTLLYNVELLASLSRRRGFQLAFVLQPSIYSTRKALSPREAEMAALAEAFYVGYGEYNRAGYRLLRELLPAHAARECYAFLDGDEAIAAEPQSVFVDHVHFGSRGNRLLGELLHRRLDTLLAKGGGASSCGS